MASLSSRSCDLKHRRLKLIIASSLQASASSTAPYSIWSEHGSTTPPGKSQDSSNGSFWGFTLNLLVLLLLPMSLQPGVGLGLLQIFLHSFRFRAATVQFLHPSFVTSSFTPSSQRNLGLPLWRFPSDSLRRTLLAKSSSSWSMKCPAHLSLLSLQNLTMSFSSHNW